MKYDLTDYKTIKALCESYDFYLSKRKGQNFLTNPSICPAMAKHSGAGVGVGILEIGPGLGVLTAELAKTAEKVVTIELDERLRPILNKTLSEFNNIEIVFGDALKLDISRLIQQHFENLKVSVCANLPYYITSPIIMRLLESRLPIDSITVMVQKEAADRLCAEPGSRASGAITHAVRYYSRPEILFDVSRESFFPSPNVDSSVIKFNILNTPPVSVRDEALFFRIVKSAFSQRRKTILNSLSAGLGVSKELISKLLSQADIPLSERAEKLRMEDFARLSELFIESQHE
ncbi:MAG TPA: 16S rRNA (adenine(1518)-N(6)/adenine(1519)-N(6))-dimethyltransferase [Ruminococcaceae bacterium]|nr:16S rRNA (adenine(1518)-N(6)/adenine(1519)-N(6))-dimethyltransferase [Oscillospiraceae bacterium]